ncbi:MAG: exo-alpha-sialidase [Candidatus Latescibacteria bacterium]|nr:exo-alpha-sialidase [Candidatus Latescibacterota bacterium]
MVKNPTKKENCKAYGDLNILRLQPVDQQITVDYKCGGQASGEVVARVYDLNNQIVTTVGQPAVSGSFTLSDLLNRQDYLIDLIQYNEAGEEVAKSPMRLFRTGYVPGTVVNYIHPEDYTFMPSGRSPASPSLLRLPNGHLLASHDIYWGGAAQNLTHVFISKDDGVTWSFQSEIFPCFWTKLFFHQGALYAFGMDGEYGDLNIFKSTDEGLTWSKPTLMCKGANRDVGGPHKAPMPVVEFKGRLWTAFEYGAWSLSTYHDAGFASIAVDDDLMVSKNWTVSDFLRYSNDWDGVCEGDARGYLEGNIVMTPEDTLVNVLRYQIEHCDPNYGRAIVLSIDDEHPEKAPAYDRLIQFHGNFSKFTINYDAISGYYYALVCRVTQKAVLKQRNCLTLTRSKNLDDWEIVRDVLNFQDNGWKEGIEKVGFQYVDWIFDGDDILFLSRTAINNAHNFHNANYMTFHRLANFRDYLDI